MNKIMIQVPDDIRDRIEKITLPTRISLVSDSLDIQEVLARRLFFQLPKGIPAYFCGCPSIPEGGVCLPLSGLSPNAIAKGAALFAGTGGARGKTILGLAARLCDILQNRRDVSVFVLESHSRIISKCLGRVFDQREYGALLVGAQRRDNVFPVLWASVLPSGKVCTATNNRILNSTYMATLVYILRAPYGRTRFRDWLLAFPHGHLSYLDAVENDLNDHWSGKLKIDGEKTEKVEGLLEMSEASPALEAIVKRSPIGNRRFDEIEMLSWSWFVATLSPDEIRGCIRNSGNERKALLSAMSSPKAWRIVRTALKHPTLSSR